MAVSEYFPADVTVFQTNRSYTKGALTNYNGIIWRFTADHPPGAWTGEDVIQIAMSNYYAVREAPVFTTKMSMGRKSGGTEGTGSIALGYNVTASGARSFAIGNGTTASGNTSYAEGQSATASGMYSHAEGFNTTASGQRSHAEGNTTIAQGQNSHAEGERAKAYGKDAHAEGYLADASGDYSHAEGNNTRADNRSQHVFGEYNTADGSSAAATERGNYVEMVGNGTAANACSNARTLDWSGNETLAGKLTLGAGPTANMDAATKQYVDDSVSGLPNKADKADTVLTTTLSRGRKADTTVGTGSFAFGYNVEASGIYSHAEGLTTTASAEAAHSEGSDTTASGVYAHAEGLFTTASGSESHSEGFQTTASGDNAHAEGWGTIAKHESQHVFGEYNVEDPSDASEVERGTYVEIVGKGTGTNARSNARTLDWNGNEVLAGKLTLGTAPANNMDAATKKYVDDAVLDGKVVVDSTLADNSTNPVQNKVVKGAIDLCAKTADFSVITTQNIDTYWANL